MAVKVMTCLELQQVDHAEDMERWLCKRGKPIPVGRVGH